MEARRNCSHTEQHKADQPEKRSGQPKDEDVSKNPQKSSKRRRSIEDAETFIQANRSEKPPSKPPLGSQSLPTCISQGGIPITFSKTETENAATPSIQAVDTRRYYRCPQCLFLCWICSTSGLIVRSRRPQEIQPEAPQSEKMPPYNVREPVLSVAMQTTRTDSETATGTAAETVTGTGTVRRPRTRKPPNSRHNGPKYPGFNEHILAPSGVETISGSECLQPSDLPYDGNQDDQDDPSTQSSVHLQIDHSTACDISTQFQQFQKHQYDEATFRALVTHYLIPFERYVDPDGSQGTRCFCKEQWNPHKEGPPPKELSKYTYDWNIQSDRTYMVATNLFEESFRKMVQSTWLCAESSGVCPYLTFDFGIGKPGQPSHSEMQVSAASAVWLFQRKKLRDELGSSDYSDLRHYSISFMSAGFQIWQAKVNKKGYSVREVASGSLLSPNEVQKYVDWSNSIHRWGLGPNARSFKREVEALYRMTRGAEQGEVID